MDDDMAVAIRISLEEEQRRLAAQQENSNQPRVDSHEADNTNMQTELPSM